MVLGGSRIKILEQHAGFGSGPNSPVENSSFRGRRGIIVLAF